VAGGNPTIFNPTDPESNNSGSSANGSSSNEKLSFGSPWPQTQMPSGDLKLRYPNHRTRGFLPPLLIPPLTEISSTTNSDGKVESTRVGKVFNQYVYTDWRGQVLNLYEGTGLAVGETREKFEVSKNLPKKPNELPGSPYSTRDHYLIFGDTSQDYFRHGLQIIDNVGQIPSTEFWETQKNPDTAKRPSVDSFISTPTENNDPVIFGFDIIIDDLSSPLLNGSVDDFLFLFSNNISEIRARIPVYEEFKNQFVKFFRTRSTVTIDQQETIMTGGPANYATSENNTNLFSTGRKAYMNYYLKKITGLSKLVENNTADAKNFLTDYGKDVITLSFTEDVSLSIGTLAHLYKLLYWSRPNAKTMIPENLLRFNCDIIISEVRNFNRVRKSIETGAIEVIKDNVSRYIYSLKECQFYFNTMPHDDSIDLGSIKVFDTYDIQFDFKYATSKFEKFRYSSNGSFGKYIGYDSGAMWKVGNPGTREELKSSSGGATPSKYGRSIPAFFTMGKNKFNENGVNSPLVLSVPGVLPLGTSVVYERLEGQELQSGDVDVSEIENLKNSSKKKKSISDLSAENPALYDNDVSTFPNSAVGSNVTTYLSNKELEETLNNAKSSGDSLSQMDRLHIKELSETLTTPTINNPSIYKESSQKEYNEILEAKESGPITRSGESISGKNRIRNLYGDEDKIKTTSVEEALKKQKQGVKLTTTLRNSIKKELQTAINTRVGLLSKSLNKILNSVGVTGVSPPKNIYTGADTAGGRIFRDIRGQLKDFLGNASGGLLQ
jgi:hypothetical protein